MSDTAPWSVPVKAADAARGLTLDLEADAGARTRLARMFNLQAMDGFTAEARFKPWLDGLRLDAKWKAKVVYMCGLSLDPYPAALSGVFTLHLLPEGSPNAPADEPETLGDPSAEDPPELYADEVVDVGDLLAQHLSVELDPFPRKPGATFQAPEETPEPSPFAALGKLALKRED